MRKQGLTIALALLVAAGGWAEGQDVRIETTLADQTALAGLLENRDGMVKDRAKRAVERIRQGQGAAGEGR